jgi:hypothetical protein
MFCKGSALHQVITPLRDQLASLLASEAAAPGAYITAIPYMPLMQSDETGCALTKRRVEPVPFGLWSLLNWQKKSSNKLLDWHEFGLCSRFVQFDAVVFFPNDDFRLRRNLRRRA